MVPEPDIAELKRLELRIHGSSGLEKTKLTEKYGRLKNRIIDLLHMELGRCAARYRAAKAGTAEDRKSMADYYRVFETLYEIAGEFIPLDPDAELPDELMPPAYVAFWLNYPQKR